MEKTELHLLIKGCLRKNRNQQKKLYVAFYDFAYSIALRYAGGREEASIIMNKGFYNAFAGLNDYDEATEFKEWLKYRVLLAAIEHLFSSKPPAASSLEALTSNINPGVINLEEGLSYIEAIKMLHRLPYSCRVVFNLFAVEGYEHEKIAAMLDISVNVSKTLLMQAREKLNYLIGLLNE